MDSVTITNLTAAKVSIDEIYANLGPAGSATASLTIERSAAQLDSMDGLKALVKAGTVSLSIVRDTNDVDEMTVPLEQHGSVATLAVDAIAVATSAVTFPEPFPTGVTPVIHLSMAQGTHTDWKAQVYARAVTHTGFTIALDVTTASATGGEKGTVNWTAKY